MFSDLFRSGNYVHFRPYSRLPPSFSLEFLRHSRTDFSGGRKAHSIMMKQRHRVNSKICTCSRLDESCLCPLSPPLLDTLWQRCQDRGGIHLFPGMKSWAMCIQNHKWFMLERNNSACFGERGNCTEHGQRRGEWMVGDRRKHVKR
jgi:hypothetical protein